MRLGFEGLCREHPSVLLLRHHFNKIFVQAYNAYVTETLNTHDIMLVYIHAHMHAFITYMIACMYAYKHAFIACMLVYIHAHLRAFLACMLA